MEPLRAAVPNTSSRFPGTAAYGISPPCCYPRPPWLPARRASAAQLISAERYAIAKLTLFQAFDERSEVHGELLVRAADLDAIMQALGIE